MNNAAAPALAVLVILGVVIANLVGLIDVPGSAYAGLALLLAGFAALAWSDEGTRER